MESKKNIEISESTNLELVLEEFTREQRSQIKLINDLTISVETLVERIISIELEIQKSKQDFLFLKTKDVSEIINKGIIEMQLIALNQQKKPIINRIQLLLFPEQDSKLFYKIIFGRWFLWLTIMLLLTNLYKFGVHWNDNQREIKLRLLEHDRIEKSWNYLYLNGSKGIKKIMDTIYNHVE